MKDFFKKLKEKLKITFKKVGSFLKDFFKYWRNWVLVISIIASLVFFALWEVAVWCRGCAFAFLSLATLIISIMLTQFYTTFIAVVKLQKKEILENLAVQFNKPEYMQLETPFNETEEKFISEKTKNYKYFMIISWIMLCFFVYATFALFF